MIRVLAEAERSIKIVAEKTLRRNEMVIIEEAIARLQAMMDSLKKAGESL